MMPIKMEKPSFKIFLILFLIALLTGCGGLPSDIKSACKKIPGRIDTGKSSVDKNHDSYLKYIKAGKLKKIKPAFTKENLEGEFKKAHGELDRAKTLYKTSLLPLLKSNQAELAPKVIKELKRINAAINDAENRSKYPLKRVKLLYDILLNMDSIHKKAVSQSGNIDRTVKELQESILNQAKNNFPDKTDKIETRFNQLVLMNTISNTATKKLDNEYYNHKRGKKVDYTVIADSAALIDKNYGQIEVLKNKFSKDIEGLSKSYIKILKDMKSIHSVVVKRESWNNYQDYYNPFVVSFVREISPEVFEFIDSNTVEPIVELYPGWNNLKMNNHIGNMWEKLKINPLENWPRQYRHDSASFWFDSVNTKYFHKYTIVEGGEKYDTDWEPVSEDIYEANFEFLGMALLTKPIGMFEDEADTKATPPGMGFVGNSEYGKWEKNSSGGSFWVWYGKYALFSHLLMGPMRYRSWQRYNTGYRGRRAYFGSTSGSAARYGTYGTYTKKSSRFKNTSFAKMGGFKQSAPSVRGASSSIRGGGPKGRGK